MSKELDKAANAYAVSVGGIEGPTEESRINREVYMQGAVVGFKAGYKAKFEALAGELLSPKRLAEIDTLANSPNEEGQRTFEIHARPMVWQLIAHIAAQAEQVSQLTAERDDCVGMNKRLHDSFWQMTQERDRLAERVKRLRYAIEFATQATKTLNYHDCQKGLRDALAEDDKLAQVPERSTKQEGS